MKRTGYMNDGRKIIATVALPHHKGNERPYFSVTAEIIHDGRIESCGCLHDDVLDVWPDLAPVVALHLSDDHGVPMHAEANGWYWLAGALGGMEQQFHGGNGSSGRPPEECAEILGKHLRIAKEDVALLLARVKERANRDGAKSARSLFASYVEGQKRRWAQEAASAIAAFNLEVSHA